MFFYFRYSNFPFLFADKELTVTKLYVSRFDAPAHDMPPSDILGELARVIDDSGVTRFNVNRSNVWQCAKRAFARHTYSPSHTMDVKFIDDIGQSEGAVDQGGPRREFLQLLLDHIFHNSMLFCGDATARHLTLYDEGIEKYTNIDCCRDHHLKIVPRSCVVLPTGQNPNSNITAGYI